MNKLTFVCTEHFVFPFYVVQRPVSNRVGRLRNWSRVVLIQHFLSGYRDSEQMSASSGEEDYHSAEEREAEVTREGDATDAADLSGVLQGAELTEREDGSEDPSTERDSKEEEKPTESLTEEEIAVKQPQYLYFLPNYVSDLPKERKEEAGQLKANGNETFKRGGKLHVRTSSNTHSVSLWQSMQRL